MKLRQKLIISIICMLAGIMVAIQFRSTQQPNERETRDLWEIRTELQTQQKLQQKLLQQIEKTENTLREYQQQTQQEKIETLKESIEILEKKAGLSKVTGEGIVITITPIFFSTTEVQEYPIITPYHLNRLINELNSYGATAIAIANERITNLSPIRYVNGETYVNNHRLPPLPLEIKVLAENPKRLLDYVQVSQAKDNFAIDSLELSVKIVKDITLPKYEGSIQLKMIEAQEIEEAGEE